jgi:hypothetical protein
LEQGLAGSGMTADAADDHFVAPGIA